MTPGNNGRSICGKHKVRFDVLGTANTEKPNTNLRILRIFASTILIRIHIYSPRNIQRFCRHKNITMEFVFNTYIFFSISLLFLTIKLTVMSFRKLDPENIDDYTKPVFKNDQTLIMSFLFLSIFSPFIFQPIMDFVVFPVLGYEYCEELSYRSETFRFPTYAYVPDPALCVAAEAQ